MATDRGVTGTTAGSGGEARRLLRRLLDLAREGEGLARCGAGEDGLDGHALHSGGTRHRTAHERDPPAVGEGHVDRGPLPVGDQLSGLLHEDRPVTGAQLEGRLVDPDTAVRAGGGFGSGGQVRPQQSALTHGTLPQQPPLDGPGRLA